MPKHDITPVPLPALSEKNLTHFWQQVDKTPGHGPNGDCWPFIGGRTTKGYGQFNYAGRTFRANRVAYFIATGVDPGALNVLHHCDWTPCCRPDHYFLGTRTDNANDRESKGRSKRGMELPHTRIAPEQRIGIKKRRAAGELPSVLAKEYGVTRNHIWLIVTRM